MFRLTAVIIFIIYAPFFPVFAAPCTPYPVPAVEDQIVRVKSVAGLKAAISNALPHTTILIEDGTYEITSNLVVRTPHITIRSASGRREAVIIDGGNWIGENFLVINAAHLTIADITIQKAYFHLIHLSGESDHFHAYNVLFIDAREQFLKINELDGGIPDYGIVECSSFTLTPSGRRFIQQNPTPGFLCYTGGIDAHGTESWQINDNLFSDIYCDNEGLSEHCIHFWKGARNTVVERNLLRNCARGIGFGLGTDGHSGGIIRNNMIWADIPEPGIGHDSAIGLESAVEVLVEHNTVYSAGYGYNAMIDARFSTSGTIRFNLHFPGMKIRDGAAPHVSGNVEAEEDMFVNLENGDLHLRATALTVIDRALAINQLDFDGELRTGLADTGADEWNEIVAEPPPACVIPSVAEKIKKRCRRFCSIKTGSLRQCRKRCRQRRCRRLVEKGNLLNQS